MNKAWDKLPGLVEEELDAANEVNPPFHSMHEGYAVILEEKEETADAYLEMSIRLDHLWRAVKADAPGMALDEAYSLRTAAVDTAAEAIQVAAMACKLIDYIEEDMRNGKAKKPR